MARTNGKSEVDPRGLDAEHELPASEEDSDDRDRNQASSGPRAPASVAAEPAGRDAELLRLKAERDTLLERLARLQAEFENARKRAAREQQEFREFALAEALKALLPILDSFERALRADHPEKEFRSGVELIHKQLSDALAKLGLRPIPAQGERFDPHVHEAIEMVDTTDAKDHEILDELQRGYKLKDRLLRPAMVKVARNPKH
jgi:molecular chaperone GrpE